MTETEARDWARQIGGIATTARAFTERQDDDKPYWVVRYEGVSYSNPAQLKLILGSTYGKKS